MHGIHVAAIYLPVKGIVSTRPCFLAVDALTKQRSEHTVGSYSCRPVDALTKQRSEHTVGCYSLPAC